MREYAGGTGGRIQESVRKSYERRTLLIPAECTKGSQSGDTGDASC